jgi:hypothetical protein
MREDRPDARPETALQGDDQPSLVDALERVTQAALEVLDKRVDLIQLEVRSAVSRSLAAGALMVGALALLMIAWVSLMAAGFFFLRVDLGDGISLGIIAAVNLVLGGVAASLGLRSWSERA